MFLALIPKQLRASHPGKFHPISLCNSIYKIITNVMENRLKPLFPLLISLDHTSYVEVHQILDGIIMAHEATRSLKVTNTPCILLKLDISKTFENLS